MQNRPYYLGTPRLSSGHMTAAECANELRHIASAMPDTAERAAERKTCLIARAYDIDHGQHNPMRHFRVIVPGYSARLSTKPNHKPTLRRISYPCTGCALYTFDEALILLETFAAKRGLRDDELTPWADGRGQRFDLGIVYDGIAEPMREVGV